MKPQRIHLTGASGSGTTTLGQALARQLGWTAIDADDHYWLPTQPPYQHKRERDERLKRILADLAAAGPGAIVSGAVIGWGPELEDAFDLIVCLQLPTEIRLQRLRQREMARHGKINQEFIDWAARYDDGDVTIRSRRRVEAWLSERRAPVLRLEGDLSVAERVAAVRAQL